MTDCRLPNPAAAMLASRGIAALAIVLGVLFASYPPASRRG
jgi:hypothetical protein